MKAIPKKRLVKVCKIGNRAATCKFIIVTPNLPGPCCGKFTEFEEHLRYKEGMSAQSDNCLGLCLMCGKEVDEETILGICETCSYRKGKK